MDEIIYDSPPGVFEETATNMARAKDVLDVTFSVQSYWPMSARGIYYRTISSPLFKAPHWLVQTDRWGTKGQMLKDPYEAVIDCLKYLRLGRQLPMKAINDTGRTVTIKAGEDDVESFVNDNTRSIFPYYQQCTAANQERYIEIWTEKEGLVHILESVADEFCRRVVGCRGFQSLPMFHSYAGRAAVAAKQGQIPTILYCGDYDPSGLQIANTVYATLVYEHGVDDLEMFRFALTPEQLSGLESVPLKNVRSKMVRDYIESTDLSVGFELDALHPADLQQECREAIKQFTDMEVLEEDEKVGNRVNEKLQGIEDMFLEDIRNECEEAGLL